MSLRLLTAAVWAGMYAHSFLVLGIAILLADFVSEIRNDWRKRK
jgi:hypothetical protein